MWNIFLTFFKRRKKYLKRINTTICQDLLMVTLQELYGGLWVVRYITCGNLLRAYGPNLETADFLMEEFKEHTNTCRNFLDYVKKIMEETK
jgi:hypothetical protein